MRDKKKILEEYLAAKEKYYGEDGRSGATLLFRRGFYIFAGAAVLLAAGFAIAYFLLLAGGTDILKKPAGLPVIYGNEQENGVQAPASGEYPLPGTGDNEIPEGALAPAVINDFLSLSRGDILYTGALSNLVKHNPPDFDLAEEIPARYLISFGIWQILGDEKYISAYTEQDGVTYITRPAVEKAAAEYFVREGVPAPADVSVYGVFVYDAALDVYSSLPYGMEDALLARVVGSELIEGGENSDFSIIRVTAEYILASEESEYVMGNLEKPPEAQKTAVITVKVMPDGSYTFVSLKTQ